MSSVPVTGPPAVTVTQARSTKPATVETAAAPLRATAKVKTTSTSVLVILVYWTAHHDSVTPAQAKRVVITEAGAWYRAASYGRQTLTGIATPWFKIAKQKCGFDFGTINAAKAAANKHGYNVAKYGRIVIYEPCGKGTETGTGEIGGNIVVLSSTDDLNLATAVHEQGHNYGLNHANLWACGLHGPVTFLAKASCVEAEYQDFSSAMGAELGNAPDFAGDFTAPQKYQLGWLSGHVVTVKASGTVALAPYETKPGVKAARISGSSGRTYWLEYRTAAGNDKKLDPLRLGVVVHMSFRKDGALSQSLLLPMVTEPDDGTAFGVVKEKEFALPPGSSWTSPEGIEFTVQRETPGLATVVVQRHKTPSKPGEVTALTVTPATQGDEGATVTFHRAPDHGLVIHDYVVDDAFGQVADVSDYTSSLTVIARLDVVLAGSSTAYTVHAVNDLGAGPSVRSSVVSIVPTVTITAPSTGASVTGGVTLSASAAAGAGSERPVVSLEFDVDGLDVGDVQGPTGSVVWDTGRAPAATLGAHTVTVVAKDAQGDLGTASEPVTLTATNAPVIAITSPTAGATLTGEATITGTASTTTGDAVQSFEIYVDGNADGSATIPAGTAPGTTSWSISWLVDYPSGSHQLSVQGTDTDGRVGTSAPVTVTLVSVP